MASAPKKLNIWMNAAFVGTWEHVGREEVLRYDEEWIESSHGRPLSLSLPFTPGNQPYRGRIVTSYFDNMLPDSEPIRRRLAVKYRAGGQDPFRMLAVLGRDCVGAIQLLPPGQAPDDVYQIRGEPLTDAGIAKILRATIASPLLGQRTADEDLRLSIAGAQEKTALLFHEDQWQIPQGSTPTTHIFKLPMGLVGNMQANMRTSVENEWLCSKIIAGFGFPIAECNIKHFEDQKALIVKRFDRRLSDDGAWLMRLPQEDMCQATGTSSLQKYEADGGPGIREIMAILAGSQDPQDQAKFFKAQIVFWLLAAIDGHAKNFSIFNLKGGTIKSTPLYDVLSAYPILGVGPNKLDPYVTKMAMAVRSKNPHYHHREIMARHWIEQGRKVGVPQGKVEAMMSDLAAKTPDVICQISTQLPDDFPMDVAETIFAGLENQAKKLGF